MQNTICAWSFLVETTKEHHWAMGSVTSLKLNTGL
jgi:hypothetical protein